MLLKVGLYRRGVQTWHKKASQNGVQKLNPRKASKYWGPKKGVYKWRPRNGSKKGGFKINLRPKQFKNGASKKG